MAAQICEGEECTGGLGQSSWWPEFQGPQSASFACVCGCSLCPEPPQPGWTCHSCPLNTAEFQGAELKTSEKLPVDFVCQIQKLSSDKKVVAIGEIGLDYHYGFPDRSIQKKIFESQLELANSLNLPVIIHDREAHQDTMELLKKYRPKGVIHCFSGSLQMANQAIDFGMYIGLGGVVTFKNAKDPVKVAQEIPINRILLETDAPYMAPDPFRGTRCDSSLINYIAEKIAQIRHLTKEEVLQSTKNNAINLFNMKSLSENLNTL